MECTIYDPRIKIQCRGVEGIIVKALKMQAQNVARALKVINNLPVVKYPLLNKFSLGKWVTI